MSWTVLHVRPRCEKKMADYCAFYAIDHYLALREETKVYQRRKVSVQKPLFPGYVFAELTEEKRQLALKSNHIVRVIETNDQQRLLRELEHIKKALSVDPTLGAISAFSHGKSVRITDGPFRGLEGIVQNSKNATRVVLNIDMIGQAVSLDVDMDLLEVID